MSGQTEEIWSTILKGVASSKMVPTKKLLVLGDSKSGKSTLLDYLKNDPGPQPIQTEKVSTLSIQVNPNYTPTTIQNINDDTTHTLALGYNFIDVQDEDNEVIARLGLYQLGLSAFEYMPLLKFAIEIDSLMDTAVLILLDWSRPWDFLETLERWIYLLHYRINELSKEGSLNECWSKGKAVLDELKEKLEHYIQAYTEPNFESNFTSLITTSTDQVNLPLNQGCLNQNLGIPIIIVCTKSDQQTSLEHTLDYKEDQFDFIQQTLRSICMKYGAGLFYTSTLQPYTFHHLRQYILHRLLTTSTKSYPFQFKPQVVERDSVMIPSGWDSWGKIRVLRDGFDPEWSQQAFEIDLDSIQDHQQPLHGVRSNYEEIIQNPNTLDQPSTTITPTISCEDEQTFLDRHFETLQQGSETLNKKTTLKQTVLGPSTPVDTLRLAETIKAPTLENSTKPTIPLPKTGEPHPDLPGAGPSHDVLATFFQSLLSKKPSVPTPLDEVTPVKTPRRATVSRKEVHKELDRIRQYVAKP